MRVGSSKLGRGGHRLNRQLLIPHRPDLLVLGAITAGVVALTVIAAVLADTGGNPKNDAFPLTDAHVSAMAEAATSCSALTPAKLAGQVMATTGFEPTADGGIAGLSADEWRQWRPAEDAVPGDDRASLLALANLTCDLVQRLRTSGFPDDVWPLAVAAFVSSLDDVRSAAGVPPSVTDVVNRAQAYAIHYAEQINPQGIPNPLPRTSTSDTNTTSGPTATLSASPTPSTVVTSASASPTRAPTPSRSNNFSIALGPISASVVQGSAATVTVTTAVTAGSAQPVRLSVSGLPAGTAASFDPATVTAGGSSKLTLQTSASTPTGTSTITVRGSGSVTDTASLSLTVTAANTCLSPGQKLGNPGFESGISPWTASSGVIDDYTGESPHSGTRFAWLGGYGETNTTRLYQTVSLPTGCASYTFSFWLHIHSSESTSRTQYDKMTVQVRNSSGTVLRTLATYSNLDEADGYRKKSFDLASFAGQTIELRFTATEDYSRETSFVVDDTAVVVA